MSLRSLALLAAIVSLAIAPLASASGVDITIRQTGTGVAVDSTHPFSTCPLPLTPQYLSIFVKNLGSSPDTYSLKLTNLPTGWTGSIQQDILLAAGQQGKVNLFLVNMPSPFSLTPGTYQFGVEARSLSEGQTDLAAVPVEILTCSAVTVAAAAPSQSLCEEEGGSKQYAVEVRNTGRFPETFSLSASVPWASLSQATLSLASGEKKNVTATLRPPQETRGIQNVEIRATSTTSFASSRATVSLNVRNCYDFSLNQRSSPAAVCLGKTGSYAVEIKNTGDADSYTFDAPAFAKPDRSPVTVPAGGVAVVNFTLTPAQVGSSPFTIKAKSSKDPSLNRTVSSSLEARECRGIAAILSPAEKTVCSGEAVQYTATLKNIGAVEETFTLSASAGTLEKTSVTLKAGESQAVKLSLTPQAIVQGDIVTVTAAADRISSTAHALLTAENCYSATLSLTADKTAVCPCSSVQYRVTLENTGKLQDTFTFSYYNTSERVTIRPGTKREAAFSILVSCDARSVEPVTAKAESEKTNLSQTSTLAVRPQDACFGVQLSNGRQAEVGVFEGVAIPIRVKNTGESQEEFTFTLQGPSWLYLSPAKLTLFPKEEDEIYLYASPPFGTTKGIYKVMVAAQSRFAGRNYSVDVQVGEGGQVVEVTPGSQEATENMTVPPSTGENESAGNMSTVSPQEGITLNVTFENITGEIIKKTDVPSFKSIAIGVITLAIIIILIVRFAILVRK